MWHTTLVDSKLPITATKKKDLPSLCSEGIIPSEYHQYFKNIQDPDTIEDR